MKLEVEAYKMYGDPLISVFLGSVYLGDIPVVGESRAGHGDDSSYFQSEEERIVAESVAAWAKAHLFNAA